MAEAEHMKVVFACSAKEHVNDDTSGSEKKERQIKSKIEAF